AVLTDHELDRSQKGRVGHVECIFANTPDAGGKARGGDSPVGMERQNYPGLTYAPGSDETLFNVIERPIDGPDDWGKDCKRQAEQCQDGNPALATPRRWNLLDPIGIDREACHED